MSKPTTFIRKLLGLRLFLMINLVVLFFLVLSFGREYVRNRSIGGEIANLQAEKDSLEARNVELLSVGQSIQTQFFLEKEGRLKYGLRKPGEELVVVTDEVTPAGTPEQIDSSLTPDSTTPVREDAGTAVSNPKRWWNFLFNHSAYGN